MVRIGRKISMVRMTVELFEEIVMLLFIELKRGVLEIKHNVKSVETGAVMMALGAGLLFFGLVTFTGTAVAVLALFLSTWLSAFIVALGLTLFGLAFLFAGLSHFKEFTLVPAATINRVEDIFHDYKRASSGHHGDALPATREGRYDPEASFDAPGRGHTAQ